MSYQTYSFPTKIGSINFHPIGLTYGNREAAIRLSSIPSFLKDELISQTSDDWEEKSEKAAQKFVDSVVQTLKKEKKVIYMAMFGADFFCFHSESLGDPEMFIDGILPFIEQGDTRKYSYNGRFASYAKILRRENGIDIDFNK